MVLENFDWIMEGYLSELFAMLLCNTVVFSLHYLLQNKVDYFVNLAACRLVQYWSVRMCIVFSGKVLEKVLESP